MPMPHRRTPRAFPGHSAATLDAMVELVRRAGGVDVDRAALGEELLAVIHYTGLAHDGSTEAVLWQSFAAAEPGPHELREVFSAAAEAENPLSPEALPRTPSNYVIRVDSLLRARWGRAWRKAGRAGEPRVATLRWEALDAGERGEIRAMLRELAARAQSEIRRHRPKAQDLDTALAMIAEVFLRHAGRSRVDWPDAGTGPETLFVRFLEHALADTATPGETTLAALARRWERLVGAERAERRAMEREWAEAAGAAAT